MGDMKLAAIINAWADTLDLLPKCINNVSPMVDTVIVVWSEKSNYGVPDQGMINFLVQTSVPGNVRFHQFEPVKGLTPHENETKKRNHGIKIARQFEHTHFLIMDADEFYLQSDFQKEKERIEDRDLNGIVCKTKVLFKSPTLFVYDHTLVPFIQKLSSTVSVGNFRHYPFAYDSNGKAHIDPTRRPSHTSVIEMSDIFMYHASWVRGDIDKKIENSSAKVNLKKSSIYKDLSSAREGVYNEFYRSHLATCPNYFNL
jgi:hypothetical protein